MARHAAPAARETGNERCPAVDGSLDKLAVPLWPDVGKALGLSRNHTYEAARSGEIPTIKIGRCLRVPLAALNKMLEDAGKPKPGKK